MQRSCGNSPVKDEDRRLVPISQKTETAKDGA